MNWLGHWFGDFCESYNYPVQNIGHRYSNDFRGSASLFIPDLYGVGVLVIKYGICPERPTESLVILFRKLPDRFVFRWRSNFI